MKTQEIINEILKIRNEGRIDQSIIDLIQRSRLKKREKKVLIEKIKGKTFAEIGLQLKKDRRCKSDTYPYSTYYNYEKGDPGVTGARAAKIAEEALRKLKYKWPHQYIAFSFDSNYLKRKWEIL